MEINNQSMVQRSRVIEDSAKNISGKNVILNEQCIHQISKLGVKQNCFKLAFACQDQCRFNQPQAHDRTGHQIISVAKMKELIKKKISACNKNIFDQSSQFNLKLDQTIRVLLEVKKQYNLLIDNLTLKASQAPISQNTPPLHIIAKKFNNSRMQAFLCDDAFKLKSFSPSISTKNQQKITSIQAKIQTNFDKIFKYIQSAWKTFKKSAKNQSFIQNQNVTPQNKQSFYNQQKKTNKKQIISINLEQQSENQMEKQSSIKLNLKKNQSPKKNKQLNSNQKIKNQDCLMNQKLQNKSLSNLLRNEIIKNIQEKYQSQMIQETYKQQIIKVSTPIQKMSAPVSAQEKIHFQKSMQNENESNNQTDDENKRNVQFQRLCREIYLGKGIHQILTQKQQKQTKNNLIIEQQRSFQQRQKHHKHQIQQQATTKINIAPKRLGQYLQANQINHKNDSSGKKQDLKYFDYIKKKEKGEVQGSYYKHNWGRKMIKKDDISSTLRQSSENKIEFAELRLNENKIQEKVSYKGMHQKLNQNKIGEKLTESITKEKQAQTRMQEELIDNKINKKYIENIAEEKPVVDIAQEKLVENISKSKQFDSGIQLQLIQNRIKKQQTDQKRQINDKINVTASQQVQNPNGIINESEQKPFDGDKKKDNMLQSQTIKKIQIGQKYNHNSPFLIKPRYYSPHQQLYPQKDGQNSSEIVNKIQIINSKKQYKKLSNPQKYKASFGKVTNYQEIQELTKQLMQRSDQWKKQNMKRQEQINKQSLLNQHRLQEKAREQQKKREQQQRVVRLESSVKKQELQKDQKISSTQMFGIKKSFNGNLNKDESPKRISFDNGRYVESIPKFLKERENKQK